MNKYLRHPDKIIDLHGKTVAEAESLLWQLVDDKESFGLCVRLVVGKGNHSKNGPVLRDFVKDFLTSKNIRHSQSKIQDGGDGALEVYL